MKKDDTLYLEMMIDHLDAIRDYTPAKQSDFLTDLQKRDAILLRLQALGEVMSHVSQEFRDQHPDWPWLEAIALRHTISHDYFAVSVSTIWKLISGDQLIKLRRKIAVILE